MITGVTYRDLITQVVYTIKTICCNINDNKDVSKIPVQLRPGYRVVKTYGVGTEHPTTLTVQLISGGINVYSVYEVENIFEDYLNNYLRKVKNIFNEDNLVTPNGALSFFEALIIFCTENVKFYSSEILPGSKASVAFTPQSYPEGMNLEKSNSERISGLITNKVLMSSIVETLIQDTILLHKGMEQSRTVYARYSYSSTHV